MGYFTISNESEYDVDLYDVISNLNSFDDNELKDLKSEIESKLNKRFNINDVDFNIKTLDDEYKVKLLKELYDKYTLEELQVIQKNNI